MLLATRRDTVFVDPSLTLVVGFQGWGKEVGMGKEGRSKGSLKTS